MPFIVFVRPVTDNELETLKAAGWGRIEGCSVFALGERLAREDPTIFVQHDHQRLRQAEQPAEALKS